MLTPGIPLTVSEWDEWGDPRDPPARAYLASYSPYDNVPDGVRPSLLVTGSPHDPRVLIHEPEKWVAWLRGTAAPGGRLLFRPELGAGAHVGGLEAAINLTGPLCTISIQWLLLPTR